MIRSLETEERIDSAARALRLRTAALSVRGASPETSRPLQRGRIVRLTYTRRYGPRGKPTWCMLALFTLLSKGPAPEKWQVQGASRGLSGDKQAYGHPPLQPPPAPLHCPPSGNDKCRTAKGSGTWRANCCTTVDEDIGRHLARLARLRGRRARSVSLGRDCVATASMRPVHLIEICS